MPAGSGVKIPEFSRTPPLAVALTTGSNEVEAQLIVPVEVVKAIGQLAGAASGKALPPAEGSTEK
jgi:alpha-D-ribose 1-methylphosphonate 5-phosphate C-P lyase